MPEPKKLRVFLSHASEDKPAVRRLCKRLKADGFDPWLDEQRLLPGQDWSLEVEKAMRASDAILLCFSGLSVAKEGYVQREYKRAMQYQQEKPEGTIFVIPVRLDACELPFSMRGIQWVDFPAGYDRLVLALDQRAGGIAKSPAHRMRTEQKKMPAKKKTTTGVTYNLNGGTVYNIDKIVAGRDVIQGNQVNYNFPEPQTPSEFIHVLKLLETQIAALRQQQDLSSPVKQNIETAEKKVAEAAREAATPKPLGGRIKTTLTEAKEYMELVGGSLQSALGLGTALGTVILAAVKLFGG
jgi:hypothetical protein